MAAILSVCFGSTMRRALPLAFVLAAAASSGWAQDAPAPGSLPPSAPGIGRAADFRKLSADIAYDRAHWRETTQQSQEEALGILDSAVLNALDVSAAPDLAPLNASLAALPVPGSIDESYRVVLEDGKNSAYALAANFGPNGPSAVRIYSRQKNSYELLDRIDRFSEPAFFDDYLVLLPLQNCPGIFVTVTGRTDTLSTGMFGAWRFANGRLQKLWLTQLLVRSSYTARPDGLQLEYCGQPDEADPAICHQNLRDVYAWSGNDWKRVSQTVVPPTQ